MNTASQTSPLSEGGLTSANIANFNLYCLLGSFSIRGIVEVWFVNKIKVLPCIVEELSGKWTREVCSGQFCTFGFISFKERSLRFAVSEGDKMMKHTIAGTISHKSKNIFHGNLRGEKRLILDISLCLTESFHRIARL